MAAFLNFTPLKRGVNERRVATPNNGMKFPGQAHRWLGLPFVDTLLCVIETLQIFTELLVMFSSDVTSSWTKKSASNRAPALLNRNHAIREKVRPAYEP